MVQALIELDDNTNRVLNIVKAQYGLKDKGEAIKTIVAEYIDFKEEPELREEFIEDFSKVQEEKGIKVADFAKQYGLKK